MLDLEGGEDAHSLLLFVTVEADVPQAPEISLVMLGLWWKQGPFIIIYATKIETGTWLCVDFSRHHSTVEMQDIVYMGELADALHVKDLWEKRGGKGIVKVKKKKVKKKKEESAGDIYGRFLANGGFSGDHDVPMYVGFLLRDMVRHGRYGHLYYDMRVRIDMNTTEYSNYVSDLKKTWGKSMYPGTAWCGYVEYVDETIKLAVDTFAKQHPEHMFWHTLDPDSKPNESASANMWLLRVHCDTRQTLPGQEQKLHTVNRNIFLVREN